ncbi:hypothetical protein Glove_65g64 [Diversispora epigaea]|uniref:Uncharacterized protein n=1 Tax=Diversispora epigaea TaxID=1348612 RepID=A0A397JAS3_9GLOM|nr:hypothetical protein Glove_65g64 [Diversispora epigaea]
MIFGKSNIGLILSDINVKRSFSAYKSESKQITLFHNLMNLTALILIKNYYRSITQDIFYKKAIKNILLGLALVKNLQILHISGGLNNKEKGKAQDWKEAEQRKQTKYCIQQCQFFDHKKLKDGNIHPFDANNMTKQESNTKSVLATENKANIALNIIIKPTPLEKQVTNNEQAEKEIKQILGVPIIEEPEETLQAWEQITNLKKEIEELKQQLQQLQIINRDQKTQIEELKNRLSNNWIRLEGNGVVILKYSGSLISGVGSSFFAEDVNGELSIFLENSLRIKTTTTTTTNNKSGPKNSNRRIKKCESGTITRIKQKMKSSRNTHQRNKEKLTYRTNNLEKGNITTKGSLNQRLSNNWIRLEGNGVVILKYSGSLISGVGSSFFAEDVNGELSIFLENSLRVDKP